MVGVGFVYKFVMNKVGNIVYCVVMGIVFLMGFVIFWGNFVVGFIGSEENLVNLMYFVVFFVGVICVVLVCFIFVGMVWMMFVMVLVVFFVLVIVFMVWFYDFSFGVV